MESKKFNWNKILSGLIAGVGILLALLFFGMCFVVPVANIGAKALSKDDIIESNINFVSAKTKIRKATSLQQVEAKGIAGNFLTYRYNYDNSVNTTPLYYTTSKANKLGNYSSNLGNVYLTSGNSEYSIFEDYSQSTRINEYIPTGVTSFQNILKDNSSGSVVSKDIENIFYDEIDNNDFVLMDNYNSYTNLGNNSSFNVENFYLSFGTQYIDEKINEHTTPLFDLRVQGKLYANGQTHNLVLNDTNHVSVNNSNNTDFQVNNANVDYWYQYFDLTTLSAYTNAEGNGSDTYEIVDKQGKYEITFYFVKYSLNSNNKWQVTDNAVQEFTYSFYLLDNQNYDTTPKFTNATLGKMEKDSTNEYFYNFTSNLPYISYDPQKFNISYTRENKEITESISSVFTLNTYSFNSRYYPYGTITYSNGNTIKKQVFIIAYYNDDKTLVDYLYVSSKNGITLNNPTLDSFVNLIENDQLTFEYKITQKLEIDTATNKYTINTYKTTDYSKYPLCTNIDTIDNFDTTNKTSSYVRVDGNDYYFSNNGQSASEQKIATITTSDTTLYNNSISYSNKKILSRLNNLNQLNVDINNIDITYDLVFDDLGIYTFNYNYNIITGSTNSKLVITNNLENSTNVLKIQDFANDYTKSTPATTPTPETKDLTLVTWGYLNTNNQVTLNGITYTYDENVNKLYFNDNGDIVLELDRNNSRTTASLGGAKVNAKYTIQIDDQGNYFLNIAYTIGTLSNTTYTTTFTSTKNGNNYIINKEIKNTMSIDFATDGSSASEKISSDKISNNDDVMTTSSWQNVIDLFKYLEDSEHNNYKTNKYTVESPTISQDILHVFGSISYFNKADAYSDTNKAKLKQTDLKQKTNYQSDITKYIKTSKGFVNTSFNVNTDFKNITDGDVKGLTNVAIKNGFDINDLIITDVTPVFFKNLSSLVYTGKQSNSYIFRYTDYKIKNGYIDYGSNVISNLYTKDTYCHQDGLYEIVVIYKYDNYKNLNTTYNYSNSMFYQVFTFIIDNSSPKFDIKVQDTNDIDNDGNTDEYIEDLGLNKFTNKNIEISWNKPTYFQNDVYIDIERIAYDGTSSDNFKAEYKQGNISVISGSSSYANSVTTFATPKLYDKKYYVYITSDNTSCNGNYKVTLHYSSLGNSTNTEEFVIDKQNISGMSVLPTIQNANGTYQVNYDNQNYVANRNNQIINYNFTFRYNKKQSNAKIETYWYKIDLIATSDYDKILNVLDKKAITTTYSVNGKDTDSYKYGNQYNYNYDTSENVLSSNYFASNSSCIYLFKMVDEAGNECRFVVFYDCTTPRFVLSPEPNNNIINDTTQITWGDYKAIKIDSESNYSLNLNYEVNNYNKTNLNDNLKEALLYINSMSTFNDTNIALINGYYYMLLPLSEVTIKDSSTSTVESSDSSNSVSFSGNNIPQDFYFFPTDPITSSSNDGKLTSYINIGSTTKPNNIEISSYSYTKAKNSDNELFDRFVTANTSSDVYHGTIGKGIFTYNIYDKQRNLSTGYVYLTHDKTQTMAYGIFDTKTTDHPSNATPLVGEEGSYAVSKLYLSSLDSNNIAEIPDYKLTYKYYQLNSSLYENLNENYVISSVTILNKDSANIPNNLKITGKQTYLQLTFRNTTITTNYLTYYVELTNEDGGKSAKHSYPYDIEGSAGEPDSSGNPQHVYSVNKSSYEVTEDTNKVRLFTKAINPVPDSMGKSESVTQEGLYIFKREYTNVNITSDELGLDSRIAYYIYYIDRTGIVNVTTLSSIANALDFGFILGSDYTDNNLKKNITSNNLNSSQKVKDVNSTSSNSYNNISNLFDTNKILVDFNLPIDKYNFNAFTNAFEEAISNKVESSDVDTVKSFLFNTSYYSNNLYKINLTLAKGNVNIIDENQNDPTKVYNSSAVASYLKGTYNTSSTRETTFKLFLEDSNSNPYNVYLKDNCGLISTNENANQLDISFYIKHTAPNGDSYGKYYGRHDYDEDKNSSHSIPINEYIDENGNIQTTYALLEKYLQNGQLEPLSLNYKNESMNGTNGRYVELYSTNNESLIFTFDITNDDTKAQIDPNNIKIYKDEISDSNLIFNRVNGTNIDTPNVSASRMSTSYFSNVINGITKYAIVVFDNNLDDILNEDELAYSNYRLLDKQNNPDSAKYFVRINYVGDSSNYIKEDNNGNPISYYSTTYEITIDREKPTYNLTKLMSLDKYVYNTVTSTVNTNNYSDVFNSYKEFYNFTTDEDYNCDRSDLENYFFALDYRENSSFVFESINELDSNGGIYIRAVDHLNYKFSKTPDDYKSYYEATYLPGNPQFSPSRAEILNKYINKKITDPNTYYYISYGAFDTTGQNSNILKASDLMKFMEVNKYYEIIEQDEAGNYRTYAVYLPDYLNTEVSFEYKINNDANTTAGSTGYNANTLINISGIDFRITNYKTSDYFAKANLTIDSSNLKETISIVYNPYDKAIYVLSSTNLIKDQINNVSLEDFNTMFIETINNQIDNYNIMVSYKNSNYYTEYGYTLKLDIIDRLGIKSSISDTKLFNYEFTYEVAGAVLEPTFKNNSNNFNMIIPSEKGTTYIEQISAYKFQGGWSPKDPDDMSNSFSKSPTELKKGTTYTLNKGVYKFVITDNFKRTNTYFYEFGSSSQTGGMLNFNDKNILHTDGYNYTSKSANFVYDNSIYDIYIKFIGDTKDEDISYPDSDTTPHIVYSSDKDYSTSDLLSYGITVATIDNITTITFSGVTDLSKYHIKTIPASISNRYGYTWGQELLDTENKFLVYDNKLAIFTAIQQPIIRNSNGNILDTSEHLSLSEDFEVTLAWTNGYAPEKQIDFDSIVYLERTYTENNTVKTETLSNSNSYNIDKPGEYVAYVINKLNNRSSSISFSRGDADIGIYSVFNVNNNVSTKLTPSAKVTSDNYETEEENRTLIEFNYFTTIDYFSFKFSNGEKLEPSALTNNDDTFEISDVSIDRSSKKYFDIQVKSDLSIFAGLHEIKLEGDTPYAKFRIYSRNNNNEVYTYRYVKVYFLDNTDYNLATTYISNVSSSDTSSENIYGTSATIKRPDKNLFVTFKFRDGINNTIRNIDGNTIFVDRYFNGELVETNEYTSITDNTEAKYTLSQVGVHKFVVRDLAGRQQTFGSDTTKANSLQIYLINQILFEVNNNDPIDNQIFNGKVNIKIISTLAGVQLYDTNTLGVKVTRNGQEISVEDNGEFSFTEAGSYVVKIDATTILADQEISTTYKFVIVDPTIAQKSFNVSSGTGFEIDKIFKIVNNERQEVTEAFKQIASNSTGSLLWLTYENQGNSIFEITLKKYNTTIKGYENFSFNVWINNEQPVIISSINNGASTKDVITLNFNPGIIYTQVGRCRILINDREYYVIDENSSRAVETITLSQKGTYTITIVSDDGTQISSYKFTKNDPISGTAKIVIICVACGIVLLVVLFLLIRRKGKYR